MAETEADLIVEALTALLAISKDPQKRATVLVLRDRYETRRTRHLADKAEWADRCRVGDPHGRPFLDSERRWRRRFGKE